MIIRLFLVFSFFSALIYLKYDREYRSPASLSHTDVVYDGTFKL